MRLFTWHMGEGSDSAVYSPHQQSDEDSKAQLAALIDMMGQAVDRLPLNAEIRGDAEAALCLIKQYCQSTEDNAATVDVIFGWFTEQMSKYPADNQDEGAGNPRSKDRGG